MVGPHRKSNYIPNICNECSFRFNIATLNARTFKYQESSLQLENALKTVNWDIIDLSEMRRAEEIIEEHDNYIFYN